MSNDLDSSTPEHMILVVWECLRRRYDDGIARVGTQGVKVFHIATNDSILGDRILLKVRRGYLG